MPNIYVTADGMVSKVLQSTAGEKLDWVKDFKRVEQWKRYKTDDLTDRFDPFTPNNRFSINAYVKDFGKVPETIIPSPLKYTASKDKSIPLPDADWVIVPDYKYTKEAEFLAEKLHDLGLHRLDIKQTEPSKRFISLAIGDPEVEQSDESINISVEAYSLNIEPGSQSIQIRSLGNAGMFYGVQSLLGIIKRSAGGVIYKTIVKDAPRFEYRGMHIDVGRNFHSNTSIMKILDAMAMVKLNKLHFHLTDDEGWRLEIPGLEELTKIGSKRCDDLSEQTCIIPQLGSGPDPSTSGSGYYTVEDYKEILQYAADRHIEIIPEVDMPGHAHSAIKSMVARSKKLKDIGDMVNSNKYSLNDPEDTSDYTSIQLFNDNSINPCIESTYTFVQHVVQQLKLLHKAINPLKTFHFGGDEVAEGSWLNSTACKKHEESKSVDALKELFTRRISNLTNAEGLDLAGWEDGLKKSGNTPFDLNKLVNRKVYGYAWSNVWEWGAAPRAHILANKGYKVVMAPATHYYFDHPYEPDPLERGHYWAARYTDTKKVFGFMPNNLYANAELQVSGEPISKSEFCGDDGKKCPDLEKPENLIGIQGNLWSETVRQPDQLDYMIFPRLLALAERAWHKAEWENIDDKQRRNKARDADWERFANNLGYAELKSLDKMNISYRVPPPGIKKDGQTMYANCEIPGLKIMMSKDGKDWKPVSREGIRVEGNLKFVTLSADEKRRSREILVESTIQPTSGSMPYQITSIAIILTCIITTVGIFDT
ncbi:hypothetical protein LOTGIDRAFT_202240 [Lottia gigantea]|uniref:beta-N-acetylhexosaminidase n=1 Tax=Lottia gigantea TaxID=225164 RepID=V4AGI1_LOTGI|nr:hypothetical protein LOTGIDRAFT_202240 [Lottia gigantea]ESO95987.1 hypothetical protein LOTGIDRAFT_202240 [Lottia gigantea]